MPPCVHTCVGACVCTAVHACVVVPMEVKSRPPVSPLPAGSTQLSEIVLALTSALITPCSEPSMLPTEQSRESLLSLALGPTPLTGQRPHHRQALASSSQAHALPAPWASASKPPSPAMLPALTHPGA